MNTAKRYRGCLLGLAAGDAYGAPYESSSRGVVPADGMTGGGPHGLQPGQWTDDTSMALCLAESLIEKNGFDQTDQMLRYMNWYVHGHMSSTGRCFGVGNTTSQALEHFIKTCEISGRPSDMRGEGNGSIMRLAPVPMFYAKDMGYATEMSGASSMITHGSMVPIDACRYLGSIIAGILRGMEKTEVLADAFEPEPGYWTDYMLVDEIEMIRLGTYRYRDDADITGSGHAPKSLEAALWAFHNTDSFKDGCRMVVGLGEDTDTTAAIFGQMAGAYYGVDGIPDSWLSSLTDLEMITSMADRLYSMADL